MFHRCGIRSHLLKRILRGLRRGWRRSNYPQLGPGRRCRLLRSFGRDLWSVLCNNGCRNWLGRLHRLGFRGGSRRRSSASHSLRSEQVRQINLLRHFLTVRSLLRQQIGRDIQWSFIPHHLAPEGSIHRWRRQAHQHQQKQQVDKDRRAVNCAPS